MLPLRNPVVLAKQLSSMDQLSDGRLLMAMAAGWYKREFDAVGVPFEQRGKIMDENLDILKRFWTEDMVKGEWTHHKIPAGVMYPKPVQKPRPPILIGGYVDRVLKRAARRAATAGSPTSTSPRASPSRGRRCATSRRRPARTPTRCMNGAQLPIMIGPVTRGGREREMMEWLGKEWDYASWSESTKDSAIMGTVDECVAQLKEHLAVGVQKLIFVPYKYEMEQIEIIASEIIPRLKA